MVRVEEYVDKTKKLKESLTKAYENVKILSENKDSAIVTKNSKKGVVEIETENEVIKTIYNDIEYLTSEKGKIVFKVKVNNKYGLIKEGNTEVLAFEFDHIEYDYKARLYLLEKDNKKGCIIFNTIYPYIKPKYLSIKSMDGIQINNKWQFGLFEVTTENGKGIVGENGVEFFRY